jgi:hypothetical protein
MRAFSYPLCVYVLVLTLAGCASTEMHMPTGYTYHNEVYKAPPGPEAGTRAKSAGQAGGTVASTAGMTYMGGESTIMENPPLLGPDGQPIGGPSVYQGVADDLIAALLRNLGRPMEPVFVNRTSPMAPALAASLTRNAVPVAINPGDGPFVLDSRIEGAHASIGFYSNHDLVRSETGASGMMP